MALPAPAVVVARILTRLSISPASPQAVFYTVVVEEFYAALAAADVIANVPPVGFTVIVTGAPTPVTGTGKVI